MELRKSVKYILNNPILTIKSVLVIVGGLSTITNIFECLYNNASLEEYILNVVILGIGSLVVLLVPGKFSLCIIMALFGVLSILDRENFESVHGGIILLLSAQRIMDKTYFYAAVYLSTFLAIIGNTTFRELNAADAVNVLLAYFAYYALDMMTFKYILNRGTKSGKE